MCGICGVWGADQGDIIRFGTMIESIRHRGPDDKGVLFEPPIALGMVRLSIIDLAGGAQPMHSHDSQVSLVFNGEIYNFRELRKEIENHYPFSTNSDTEVILNGYLLWGEEVFRRLNGMFAVALWDRKESKLLLARDPMGIKPLYVLEKDRKFYFSSEIKTFTLGGLANRIDKTALTQFLAACYTFRPGSAIDGVVQVEPGQLLTLAVGKQIKRRVFRLPGERKFIAPANHAAAQHEIGLALDEAVLRQTVADVPYGLLLSAGVDSMAVVAGLHRRGLTENLRTYTLFFPDAKGFSEDQPVRKIATQLNLDSAFIPFTAEDLISDWDAICKTFDNLELLPTAALIYSLSRVAAQDRRMVLAGNGGDEMFSGYPTYVASRLNRRLRPIQSLLKAPLPWLAKALPVSSDYLAWPEKLRRFAYGLSENAALAHAQWRHIFTYPELAALLKVDFLPPSPISLYGQQMRYHDEAFAQGCDAESADQWMDLRGWMIDNALMMWDKAGMASGLEIRVPLIDLDFADRVLSLPTHLRSGGRLGSKQLLRNILAEHLPSEIAHLPKHGFQMPLDQWMRGQLRPMFRELTASLPHAVFHQAFIERIWQEFDARRGDHALKLWALGALAGWARAHRITWP
jgi:asparagine synthase (glutamine-hydrolysing)